MLVKIKNNIEEIARICDKVKEFCVEHNVSSDKYHDIALILDEIVANVINYAYPDGNEHTFNLQIEKNGECVSIRLVDDGAPFNPLAVADPNVNSSIEERQMGGLGIFIVKRLSEVVEYSRIDDQNQLDIRVSICSGGGNHGN